MKRERKIYDPAFKTKAVQLSNERANISELARELGVNVQIVHIPSDIIVLYNQELGDGLLGDKAHSMIFDNSKIRRFVPEFQPKVKFQEGAKEVIKWYLENTSQLEVDKNINDFMDKIISDFTVFKANCNQ